jgi:hypothetical protein
MVNTYPPKKKHKNKKTTQPNSNDWQAQVALNAFLSNLKTSPSDHSSTSNSHSFAPSTLHPNPHPKMAMDQDTDVDLFPSSSGVAGSSTLVSNTAGNDTASTSSASAADNTQPHTPPNNDLNAAALGELSPPRSQGEHTVAAAAANGESLFSMGQQNGHVTTGKGKEQAMTEVIGGPGQWQPGEWKSKKSQEEMARAWESVVDRDWDPRQFGDVVLKGRQQRGL